MNMRIAVMGAAAVMLMSSSALFADPPDIITLSKPEVFGSLSRPPVRFPHGRHVSLEGVSCLTCHHAGDASVQCETCHMTARSLQLAFHQLCITCHDTEKKQGRASGPRACGECHR
ncbi:MAG: cytochrome c3 family protein [Spirochaetia bacterium]|jgi:hypothetical protein